MAAGGTLCLHAGTYTGAVSLTTGGTSAAPKTLQSYPGEYATVTGQGTVDTTVYVSANYINLVRFAVTGAAAPNAPTGCPGTGVWVDQPSSNITLEEMELYGNQAEGFLSDEVTHFITIDRSYVHDNGPDPRHICQAHGIYLQGADLNVTNSLIVRHPYGWDIHNYDYARRVKLINNTVTNGGVGLILIGGSGTGPEGTGVSDVDVVNNIASENGNNGEPEITCSTSGPPSNVRVHHNLTWDTAGSSGSTNCAGATNNLFAAPNFVTGPDPRGFYLGDGSPGIDSGDPAFLFSPDLSGVTRPIGVVDRGARER